MRIVRSLVIAEDSYLFWPAWNTPSSPPTPPARSSALVRQKHRAPAAVPTTPLRQRAERAGRRLRLGDRPSRHATLLRQSDRRRSLRTPTPSISEIPAPQSRARRVVSTCPGWLPRMTDNRDGTWWRRLVVRA